jgi:hypothetical protein
MGVERVGWYRRKSGSEAGGHRPGSGRGVDRASLVLVVRDNSAQGNTGVADIEEGHVEWMSVVLVFVMAAMVVIRRVRVETVRACREGQPALPRVLVRGCVVVCFGVGAISAA